jgi:cupin fold WbuC family metalloprotein
MEIYSAEYLAVLSNRAAGNERMRQHQNIHKGFDEPCQRLFNAIEPGSYIRPHRHASVLRNELMVAVRGVMALVTFDDVGQLQRVVRFGSEKYGCDLPIGLEINPETWHTVMALEAGSVLLEVKAGPFDPAQPKDLAGWAPSEGSSEAQIYVNQLRHLIETHK